MTQRRLFSCHPELVSGSKPLVIGSHNSVLAQKAARALDCDFITFSNTRFSDTESNITLELSDNKNIKISDRSILLFFQFQSQHAYDGYVTQKSQALNDQLFDVLLVIQMLKKLDAKKISLILPYLPYARQEKNANFGHLIKQVGVDELIVADMHTERLHAIMSLLLHNIPLTRLWKQVLDKEQENICLVSPDAGGCQRVQALVDVTGYLSAFIKKKRDQDGRPKALELVGDVTGKTVILVDDIVDTAQTALSACDFLFEHGAAKVIAYFSHAVLSSDAYEKLKNSRFERIFLSDTLLFDGSKFDKKFTIISMHDLIIEYLRDIKNI